MSRRGRQGAWGRPAAVLTVLVLPVALVWALQSVRGGETVVRQALQVHWRGTVGPLARGPLAGALVGLPGWVLASVDEEKSDYGMDLARVRASLSLHAVGSDRVEVRFRCGDWESGRRVVRNFVRDLKARLREVEEIDIATTLALVDKRLGALREAAARAAPAGRSDAAPPASAPGGAVEKLLLEQGRLEAERAHVDAPAPAAAAPAAPDERRAALEARRLELEMELEALLADGTERHPLVVRARRELVAVRARLAESPAKPEPADDAGRAEARRAEIDRRLAAIGKSLAAHRRDRPAEAKRSGGPAAEVAVYDWFRQRAEAIRFEKDLARRKLDDQVVVLGATRFGKVQKDRAGALLGAAGAGCILAAFVLLATGRGVGDGAPGTVSVGAPLLGSVPEERGGRRRRV